MINKSIPNFRKLVLIFGGPMRQTRRRRCRRSSGNTTLRPHEQKSGSSSSHTAPPASRTSVNLDDDQDDFMPPNHGLQDLISEPEVRPVVLDHLQHHLVLRGMTMMISCPPNLGLQDLMKFYLLCINKC